LKKIIFLVFILAIMSMQTNAGAFDIRVVVPPPVVVVPAPPPPPAVVVEPAPPPPPAVVVEPAPVPEPQPYAEPVQEPMPQDSYGPQDLPPDEYIPEGDPTPPQPLTMNEPEMVVVPSGDAQVYMIPNTVGVYFYGGTWYRHHHGVWFTANAYNGGWVYAQPAIVPGFVVNISPAYALYLPPSYHRIRYYEFHSHWRTWDRDRHWHRHSWFQNERRADIRRDRERLARERMMKDRKLRDQRIKEKSFRPHKGPGQNDQFKNRKTGGPDEMKQHKSGQTLQQKRGPYDRTRQLDGKQQQKLQPKSQPKPQPKSLQKAPEKHDKKPQ